MTWLIRISFYISFLLFFQNNILGQAGLPYFRIGTAQGLSQSTIFSSFQDSRGFLWFGTAEGLNRYDGYNFKVFRHILNDSTSLSSNDINTIGEDASGNIWVGTRTRGISILNIKTLKFNNSINHEKGLNFDNSGISKIFSDKEGNIWFAVYEKGIFIQNFKSKKITKVYSEFTKNITSAYLDKKGNIWLANINKQLLKFTNGKLAKLFQIYTTKSQINSYISGITMGASGLVYLTTSANGLFSLNENNREIKNCLYIPNIIDGPNNMKAIVSNKENTMYITTNDGLLIVENENFANYFHQKSNSTKRFALSTHALMNVLIDKNENIWIGTWEGGINVNYKKLPDFDLLRHEVGVSNGPLERKITSVAASNTSIWLGTNIGLSHFDRTKQTWQHFKNNTLSGQDINALKFDNEGDLFISAYQKDLNIYFSKTNSFKKFKNKEVKINASISAFAEEKSGKTWIATTNSGIYLFDKKTGVFESLNKKYPSLNFEQTVTGILQDNNKLWLGTVSNGVYILNLNSGKLIHFKSGIQNSNLGDEHILGIFKDSSKRIWVGTNGGGLNLFNPKTNKFITISEQDGLPNNTIKSIIEDNKGILWLSTNKGICSYNTFNKEIKEYTEADGLQGNEFGRAVGAINNKGEVFFGGTNGLTYFHPANLELKPGEAPKIYFTGLKLFNKYVEIDKKGSPLNSDISFAKELTLQNNQSVFTIEYLALDFQQLKNYQYAFKLQGFDEDWNYVGLQRNASYTNMHEGTYYFHVKATNNTGAWSNKITTLKITILPPWYRTIWAYMAYFLLGLLSLYFWRKTISVRERLLSDIKIQKIEAQKNKEINIAKNNFFTNISHEFRTPLTLIISPIQHLIQSFEYNPEELNKQHNLILKNAQRLLRLINQILDISKIEAGSMKLEVSKNDVIEFLSSIALSFKVLAEQNEIQFNVNIKNTIRYCYFDKDIIEKISFNLLSNAFKFTPKWGQIDMNIEISNQILKIEVVDNGIGMDKETTNHIFERYYQADGKKLQKSIGTGIGLALTKELTELHLGNIEVQSEPNLGSKFIIEIPINPAKFDIVSIKENFDFEPIKPYLDEPQKTPNTEINLENDAPILLIVEDNDELREYLVGIFETKYKVIQAENGKIGLEKAIEAMPDFILSDYIMPEMDGGEFCKAIKTNEKTSHIPFVLLTSKQSANTINESFDTGADDYIIKPFNVSILTKRIESILKARAMLKQKFGNVSDLLPQEAIQNETESLFFNKIISIIESKIDDSTFDVAALENELNMSKMQLYRKLKGVSNLAPNEFIRNIRLKTAAKMMETDIFNISEIAFKVGFNDPAYFTKCFRKEFGKSPSDYINQKVK
jgi:signal transduction histidine kinase/ligand-binding sensor domain-containing protein/DNA-binding response OmpR family regulator